MAGNISKLFNISILSNKLLKISVHPPRAIILNCWTKLLNTKMSSSVDSLPRPALEEEEKNHSTLEEGVPKKEESGEIGGVTKEATDGEEKIEFCGPKRIKKHKFVMMMSYCGKDYYGMQLNRNEDYKTIEYELIESLYKNGFIEEAAYKKPQSIHFQRAARTDKGVSAARQIVSLNLPITTDIEKINESLVPQIRVMGMKRVTAGFDSKKNCDSRTYSYMLPTFAFAPLETNVTEDFRINPELLERVRESLKIYLGGKAKNFHNFTAGKKPGDPSCLRIMREFTCTDPFIKDGLEFVILRVRGQSFMLHQIRKMVGLLIALHRGYASMETVDLTWLSKRVDIPKAPGLGLMLEHVHFEAYNRKYGSDGMHVPLTWEEYDEKVTRFCDEFIYPNVVKTEKEEKSMFNWLTTLPIHTYQVREPGAPGDRLSELGKAEVLVKRARGENINEDNYIEEKTRKMSNSNNIDC